MKQYSNEKIEAVRDLLTEQAKIALGMKHGLYDFEGTRFLRYYIEYMEGVNSGLYM